MMGRRTPAMRRMRETRWPMPNSSFHQLRVTCSGLAPTTVRFEPNASVPAILNERRSSQTFSQVSDDSFPSWERATLAQHHLAFAWSPNGRVLADYGAGNGVDIYECPTGHKLTSLSLQSQDAAPSAEAVALRWSPDGSHLLLSSTAFGLVSLWKVKPS